MGAADNIHILSEKQRRAREQIWPDTTAAGKPKATYPNARVALLTFDNIQFAHDQFSDRATLSSQRFAGGCATLSDENVAMLRQEIVDTHGFDAGKDNVLDAALQLCREGGYDTVVDYLDRIEWDKRERVDTWLTDFVGAEDTPLNRAFGRKTLIAAVRRARRPGCKFDSILALEGAQGGGKSSVVAALAGDASLFSDQDLLHLSAREQQEAVQGTWLYEISELAGLGRTDIEKIKAFASRTHDRARPAYGRMRVDQPRRCIFVATTNQEVYLRDATGNRRFWPVKVGKIRLDELRAARDQLWAEAAAIEATGETLELPQSLWSLAGDQQEARLEDDPWLELLEPLHGHYVDGVERVAFAEVMEKLFITAERQTPFLQKRAAECMRRLGWSRSVRPFKLGQKAVRGYTRPVTQQPECN